MDGYYLRLRCVLVFNFLDTICRCCYSTRKPTGMHRISIFRPHSPALTDALSDYIRHFQCNGSLQKDVGPRGDYTYYIQDLVDVQRSGRGFRRWRNQHVVLPEGATSHCFCRRGCVGIRSVGSNIWSTSRWGPSLALLRICKLDKPPWTPLSTLVDYRYSSHLR